uniref:Major tail protein n=1 Tax=Podoviridae sp. ctJYR5 TaxID=2826551 RepID=A0A8S5N005_9CAUD|nr:MAG TPA: Major tail protein [Podoviridae sp. ctJYR5]
MSEIYAMPPETRAGLSFDYSVWSAGSVITMVNVPFDNTYRDIVDWKSYGHTPYAYVKSFNNMHKVEINQMTYLAQGKPIRIPTPFTKANQYNYVMVENPGRPVNNIGFEGYTPSVFFYFITSIDYIAPNTTQLTLQLDVWTTYYQRINFGRSYLERGHMGIAATDSFDNYGKNWLTQPEGLDMGSEHQIIRTYRRMLADITNNDYSVIVTSTVNLDVENGYGDANNPRVSMADPSNAEGLPNGVEIYVCTYKDFRQGMLGLKNYPWIAQGIGSITIVPKDIVDFGGTKVDVGKDSGTGKWTWLTNHSVYINRNYSLTDASFRNEFLSLLPKEYQELKKFVTSPYCIVELTTYSGNPVEFRPESIRTAGININQYAHVAPPNPSLFLTIRDYNTITESVIVERRAGKVTNEYGEGWDMCTGYTSLPTFSAVNNSALNALASSAHTAAAQVNNAKWQQQRAQRAATAARDVANAGIAATQAGAENSMWGNSAMADSQSRYNNMRATVQATQGAMTALGGVMGLNGSAAGAGIGQAATAGVSAMINNSQAQSTANIQNQLASGASQISQQQQRTVRDTNYELAQFAANGDYEAAIASINGQRQDMQVIPPSVVGQTSGYVSAMVSNGLVIDARIRSVSPAAMRSIGDFWLRYGYLMNTWIKFPKTLSLMTEFTYWKMAECYLVDTTIPEGFKASVRGIFEKGVTVWRSPQRIGNTNVRNNRIDKTVRVTLSE